MTNIDATSTHDLMKAFLEYCREHDIAATFDELQRFRTIYRTNGKY